MATKPRRRRDSGDICQLRVELWAGIRCAAQMVDNPKTPRDLKLRAVSALATAASVYARLLESLEYDTRLQALETLSTSNGHAAPSDD